MQQIPVIEAILHEAISHLWAGRLGEAESSYRAALEVHPNLPDAHNNLGALALQRKQPIVAARHFRAALDSRPNHRQYWLSYINALIQAGHAEAARDALDEARKRGLHETTLESCERCLPSNGPSRQEINSLISMFTEEQYQKAESLAREMTTRFPLNAVGWTVLGGVLRHKLHYADALACMQKATELSPVGARLKLPRCAR
jgi:predicted Zn-dependent protease